MSEHIYDFEHVTSEKKNSIDIVVDCYFLSD